MAWGPILQLDTVDSTNDECKRRAALGAPQGLAVMARSQTGGKGRRGRSFLSLPDRGLYLSLLLRPACTPRELLWLTPWVAVAVCDAIQSLCGVRPGVKWPNDLILADRKCCGILTELGTAGGGPYAVVGIGVNLTHTAADFGPDLAPVAVSLREALGAAPHRLALGEAVLASLEAMSAAFPREKAAWLARYRADCLTVGRPVTLLRDGRREEAVAEGVDEDFALVVRHPDGRREAVTAGEVSVRGLAGHL